MCFRNKTNLLLNELRTVFYSFRKRISFSFRSKNKAGITSGCGGLWRLGGVSGGCLRSKCASLFASQMRVGLRGGVLRSGAVVQMR